MVEGVDVQQEREGREGGGECPCVLHQALGAEPLVGEGVGQRGAGRCVGLGERQAHRRPEDVDGEADRAAVPTEGPPRGLEREVAGGDGGVGQRPGATLLPGGVGQRGVEAEGVGLDVADGAGGPAAERPGEGDEREVLVHVAAVADVTVLDVGLGHGGGAYPGAAGARYTGAMSDPVRAVHPLGFVWQTQDPFLFCVHHLDRYPRGNEGLGPDASLAGRDIGQDFAGRDGWRMYHGETVPGFPSHPHRGFETVTILRRGLVDHSDSLGAAARFGPGDTQWMTAGRGIVHAEMFPLVHRDADNPLELFQIWLNLPRADKMVEPHFAMLWRETVPVVRTEDAEGRAAEVMVVAGRLGDAVAPAPPPRSWAARPEADVAIWSIRLAPGARWTLPPAAGEGRRTLYLFDGAARVGERDLRPPVGAVLEPRAPVPLVAGPEGADLLLLQGRPIGEPVVAHGPFVMNTPTEIHQAFQDYQRTRFGGWPWGGPAPTHPRAARRFARHADGRLEERGD